jgi:chemotaxis methyl-accepting protein methylase
MLQLSRKEKIVLLLAIENYLIYMDDDDKEEALTAIADKLRAFVRERVLDK